MFSGKFFFSFFARDTRKRWSLSYSCEIVTSGYFTCCSDLVNTGWSWNAEGGGAERWQWSESSVTLSNLCICEPWKALSSWHHFPLLLDSLKVGELTSFLETGTCRGCAPELLWAYYPSTWSSLKVREHLINSCVMRGCVMDDKQRDLACGPHRRWTDKPLMLCVTVRGRRDAGCLCSQESPVSREAASNRELLNTGSRLGRGPTMNGKQSAEPRAN